MSDHNRPPAAEWPAPAPVPPAPSRRSPLRWIVPTLAVLVAVVAGLAGGIVIGKHTATASAPFARTGTSQFGGQGSTSGGTGNAGSAGGFVSGTITAVHGDTLTVTTTQGTKETITVPSSATVTTTKKASLGSLKAGEHVTAIGTAGSGSLSASRVSEGQTGLGGGRGGFRGSAG